MAHHHHEVSGAKLFITIILNLIITIAEIIGGIFANSLALLSDALHNFSDVMALIIAYIANRLAGKSPNEKNTFGLKRAEIIAALFNASVLIGIGVYLIIESVHKIIHPEHIKSLWVIGFGFLSVVLNSASVLLIKDDSHDNLNIKAAYLHLLTDVATSIAVIIGGVVIYYFKIYSIDAVISLVIAVYLIYSAFDIVKESTKILMQYSPEEINLDEVIKEVEKNKKIKNIHHIHIWKLNEHDIFLEAHIDLKENLTASEISKLIDELEKELEEKFHITHTTFQIEYKRDDDKSKIKGDSHD